MRKHNETVSLFVDVGWHIPGDMLPLFKEAGYEGTLWREGKVRTIPLSLAMRCKQSGAPMSPAEPGMPEDNYRDPEATPPVLVSQDDAVTRYKKQFAKEKKLRVMVMSTHGWSDGYDKPRQMFAALEMPASLQFTQIVELPASLITWLQNTGLEFTAAAEEMAQYEGMYQNRFNQPLQAWRAANAEKIRAKEAAEAQKQNAEDVKQSARRKLLKVMTEAEAKALGLLL
jgi:hypothetical protein